MIGADGVHYFDAKIYRLARSQFLRRRYSGYYRLVVNLIRLCDEPVAAFPLTRDAITLGTAFEVVLSENLPTRLCDIFRRNLRVPISRMFRKQAIAANETSIGCYPT